MKKILQIGNYFPVEKDGVIENCCSYELIPYAWRRLTSEISDRLLSMLPGVYCIYLRGSVARGRPIDGCSDLDLVIVFKDSCSDHNVILQYGDIIEKYPFCVKIDTTFLSSEGDVDLENKFLIKTQSLLLSGENISIDLPRYKIEDLVDIYLPILKEDLAHYKAIVTNAEINDDLLQEINRKSMKRILRVGGILAFQYLRRYTPDLFLCYESFKNVYPQHSADMRRALEIAVFQDGTPDELRFLYFGLGDMITSNLNSLDRNHINAF